MPKNEAILTVGEAAQRLHVQAWCIRRLFERGILPDSARVGRVRVIPERDLSNIEKALEQAGYLKRQEAARSCHGPEKG